MSHVNATVFIVDDDASVLKALERLLRSAGWATAAFASPDDFLRQRDPVAPGCLLLDVSMPGLDGLELQRKLADAGSALPIIFLTGYGDVPTSVKAMRCGAMNFLSKPVQDEELLASVAEAVAADRVAGQGRAEITAARQRLTTLTARERQVLERVVAGRLNKQIADELGTVEKTIKVHRARVMQKMEAQSLVGLARLIERTGLLAET